MSYVTLSTQSVRLSFELQLTVAIVLARSVMLRSFSIKKVGAFAILSCPHMSTPAARLLLLSAVNRIKAEVIVAPAGMVILVKRKPPHLSSSFLPASSLVIFRSLSVSTLPLSPFSRASSLSVNVL